MSNGNQNKFLIIYFSALGVGALALGYLAWSASSTADEEEIKYQAAVTDLDRLERAPLSRTKENAAKKKELVNAYVEQVKALNTSVMAYQAPLNESESNQSFQNKLTQAITAIKAESPGRIKLVDKFDYGMTQYVAGFPVPGTAPRLSAQLDALIFLTTAAMDAGVSEINSLTRTPLDFETEKAETPAPGPGAKPKPTPAPKPAAGTAPKPAAKKDAAVLEEKEVFEKQPVSFSVTGKNISILNFLTKLANASPEKMSPHFVVVRTLRIENEKKDGPPKTQEVKTDEVEETVNGVKKTYRIDSMYVLGNEQVKLFVELDILRFVAEPAAPEKPGPKTKPTAAAN